MPRSPASAGSACSPPSCSRIPPPSPGSRPGAAADRPPGRAEYRIVRIAGAGPVDFAEC